MLHRQRLYAGSCEVRRAAQALRVVSDVDVFDEVSDSRAVAVLVVIPVHRPTTHAQITYKPDVELDSQEKLTTS